MTLDLQSDWDAFWTTLHIHDAALRDEYYALIAAHMNEAHRAYHNLAHVRALLQDFSRITDLVQDPASFAWKIWFHDLIYSPGAPDNERKSAETARAMARKADLGERFGSDVFAGIMATQTHAASTEDDRLLVTLDLAILGADEARFDEYERQIESEFRTNPEISADAYRQGRLAWARAFDQRDPIYPTEYGRREFEAAAHGNLARSIDRLKRTAQAG